MIVIMIFQCVFLAFFDSKILFHKCVEQMRPKDFIAFHTFDWKSAKQVQKSS